MGVPAFFRWLCKKYPSIVVNTVEEKPKKDPVTDQKIQPDTSKPNPNGIEFDNLYLDMNGIIHPCTHPEDRPAPKNEDEMMVIIFEFIDRLFSIVRPRKLLYMAIDGVAPRAKMNQQRSRRFRAAKDSYEKKSEIKRLRQQIVANGGTVPTEKPDAEQFDSNCITPGTPFMHKLAECLRYYVNDRLNNDPGWKNIKVILSDASVPGEGEHKIMDYIRRQRTNPDHDPNTQHVLCGADADLIMLGLATHEPNFTIIREEFKPNSPRPCEICNQYGHETKECTGTVREKRGEHDELSTYVPTECSYIFLRLCVLREYLQRDLYIGNLPFPFDIERIIDDWVFMCFFVGNDFLPVGFPRKFILFLKLYLYCSLFD
jgi:5'-3' exoribonuclease 2